MPALLVGVTQGPGGIWARSYMVVPIASIMSDGRASRVSVRIVTDVVFPEECTFPLKQRLLLHGAYYEDANLPAPHTADEGED